MQTALFESDKDSIKEDHVAVLLYSLAFAINLKEKERRELRQNGEVIAVEDSGKSDDSDLDASSSEYDDESDDEKPIVTPQMWAKLDFAARLRELKMFKKKFGHCKVPQLFKENPSMGLWVRDMRVKKRKGKLSENVERELTAIGFVWDCRTRKRTKNQSVRMPWDERFDQLKGFVRRNGHCHVPSSHKNRQLYHWVTNQRRDYRCGVMTYERVEMLENLGFEWNNPRK
eukprot:TRINITY_DN427_c0_g1_i1.p1 TRINITY_DN427_c0_g1~~TRINITY_DN427_c0_g1_i1.p1  ORF type:complete len:229 (-),score=55.22 TRINITY_DN427_c0_g1_i1:65-751(-)